MKIRKLKYLNRITSIAVTIILFIAAMFIFEACSSDNVKIGSYDKGRIIKVKSVAENKVNSVFGITKIAYHTACSALNMSTAIISDVLRINANVLNSVSDVLSGSSVKSGGVGLY